MKDAVRPGRYPWETARRGEWRRTQSGPWLLCEPPPEGNCVAMVSVRSAIVADGPERVKPAAPLPVSGNCAAAVWGSGRSLLSARPHSEDREAFQPLRRRVSPKGKGIMGNAVLFLFATSLRQSVGRETALGLDTWWNAPCAPVGRYAAPGIGIPGEAHRALRLGRYSTPGTGMPCEARPCAPVGWGCRAGAPQARPTNASAWVRTKRDQTLRPRRPMRGAINSSQRTGAQRPEGSAPATERCPAGEGLDTPTAERCPAGEGLKHSSRRTGPRKKDLNTPTTGPCCLRRATSNPQRQRSLKGD